MEPAESKTTAFDRIGGVDGVRNLVVKFYKRVFADAALRPYFNGAKLEKLHAMQYEFFATALDGPIAYSGRSLYVAHQDMHIPRAHFQLFVGHLLETLKEFPLADDQTYAVIARVNTYADEIIGTSAEST
jgi:hemoglobin